MTDVTLVGVMGAIAAVVGGLVGGLFTSVYEHRRERRDRPILALDFVDSRDVVEATWENVDRVLARLRVRNVGVRSALNCSVFIISITEIHNSGETQTNFKESRLIPWAGYDFNPRAVPRGVDFYVDIAHVQKDIGGWNFAFKTPPDAKLRDYKGTYRFRVNAVADNADAVFLNIDVGYDGDWHQFRGWPPK
jgi:hypothetical protein